MHLGNVNKRTNPSTVRVSAQVKKVKNLNHINNGKETRPTNMKVIYIMRVF